MIIISINMIGPSPSGKAPGFDPDIRRFESCRPSQRYAKTETNQRPLRDVSNNE